MMFGGWDPPNRQGEVVGGASCSAKGFDFALYKLHQGVWIQQSFGFLKQKGLVRAASSFGHELELVRIALQKKETLQAPSSS